MRNWNTSLGRFVDEALAGRRRQSHWTGGLYWDEIIMDCLATEFTSPVLSRVFEPDAPRS